jgi:predicted RNA-binding protein with PUA-like domain
VPCFWLLKSEPQSYGFERLAAERRTEWSGVRNYQARNFMDAMRLGDLAFFYHSATKEPGIAGICRVVREAYPDHTALDPKSPYYDSKSTAQANRWRMVDVEYEAGLPRFVTLHELRRTRALHGMVLLQRGSRLSVQPVADAEWETILKLSSSRHRPE